MNSKLNIVLGLLVVLAAGYTFVFEYQKPQQDQIKKEQDSRLITLKVDQINHIEFDRNGSKTLLEKKDTGWYLTQPFEDEADTILVQDFLDSLAREVYFDFVSETSTAPLDSKTFGFDAPLAKVTFSDNSGSKNSFTLSSKKNFEGHSLLMREGDTRIFIVNTVWQSLLMRDNEEFRNRQLFRGKVASINGLELRNRKGLLQLKLDNGAWLSEGERQFAVDQNKVREILSSIAESKYTKWLKAGAQNSSLAGEWGLLKPSFELKVKRSDKDYDLLFGKGNDQKTFIYLSQTQAFAELPPHIYEKFESYGVDFVRDKKRAFGFDTTKVHKIFYKGELKALEKNKAEEGFSSFLKIFSDSEVLRFESSCKLKKITHAFQFETDTQEKIFVLYLGETLGEGSNKVFCAKTSAEVDLFVLPESFLKTLQEHSFFRGPVLQKEDK